ncbi:MAG TPA: peptide ABC transporter substrate-binding protein [Candidatus Elarobacter sp.]|nr:peptide ABC transporter substrate-binding protein [Candidatus Elarobacter sp.]
MGVPVLSSRLRAAALALVASAMLLAAVPGSSGAQAERSPRARHPYTIPHVLRYATGDDIVGLNPHLAQQLSLAFMSAQTMAWLVRFDKRNRPVPELATAVPSRANGGVSADGKTITYHLRRDAKWSDGVPFDAQDVRFSVGVVQNPANNEGTHVGFDLVEKVDVPDPYTAIFRLKRPWSGFYVNFFSSGGANPCVLPRHLLDKLPNINDAPYNALPVGIGPFKYASWKRADSVELVRDPLYFGRKPKLERIVFKIIPDRNTVLTQLTTHEIDLWAPVPAGYYDRVRAVPGIKILRQPSYGYNHIDFNVSHAALRDPAVRRALRLAIDRRTILEKVRHGVGILQDVLLPPGHPMHVDAPIAAYDPAAANRMLDAAGWKRGPDGIRAKNGLRLEFSFATVSGTPDTDQLIELVRADWLATGVSLDVRHYPSPLIFAPAATGGILYSGKYDAATYAWILSPNGDLTNLFGCDRVPPKGQNVPRYCDREVDRANVRFTSTYDEREQLAASRFVQGRIARDVPTIVLDAREDVYAFNDDLHGFAPNQATAFDDLVDADI